MKYEKPAVITIASAVASVQNSRKGYSLFIDVILEYTIDAYEADE
jgi:hypothetical protein